MFPSTDPRRAVLSVFGASLALLSLADAGSRRFAYSYETTTMPKGAMELETTLTWKTDIAEEPELEKFELRHEFEYGVTDRLQMAFYFADWSIDNGGEGGKGGTDFQGVAVEAIYNLTDPNTSPFGSALYGEVAAGEGTLGLEGKFLLQKNIGAWMFVYNVGGEVEWEEDYDEKNGELFQTLGASYQLNPSWSVGAEVLHEVYVPEVEEITDSGVFAGPNFSWRNRCYSVAVAGLWELTSLEGEPDFQLRTIFSFSF